MRIRMIEEILTVGCLLEKGKVYEIQGSLAKALLSRGQAEDPFASKAGARPGPAAPAEKPELEVALTSVPAPAPIKAPAAPKRKPAKKPAAKKAKR